MKKTYLFSIAAIISVLPAQAQLIESWDFQNGTQLNDTQSNLGTTFSNNASDLTSVTGGVLQFISEGSTPGPGIDESTFRFGEFANPNITSGVYTVSFDFVSVDFGLTDTADGVANIGFDFRDNGGTFTGGGDDTVLGSFRLRFQTDNILLQLNNSTVATFTGQNSLSDLNVLLTLDLNNAGNAGSFGLEYTLGAGPTVDVGSTVALAAGQLDGYRINQQTINGTTSWEAGDVVTIDNFALSLVPEPSSFALIAGWLGLASVILRRR